MKTTLQSALDSLSVALLMSFVRVGPKGSFPMNDEDMPGRPLR